LKENQLKTPILNKSSFSLIDIISRFRDASDVNNPDKFNPTKQLIKIVEIIKETITNNPGKSLQEVKNLVLHGKDGSFLTHK
jgi:hypothetical protein